MLGEHDGVGILVDGKAHRDPQTIGTLACHTGEFRDLRLREAARSAEEGLLDVGLNPAEQMSIDVDRNQQCEIRQREIQQGRVR